MFGFAHWLRVVAPELNHAIVSVAVQDASLLCPIGAVTAEDARFPDEKEKEHIAQPAEQPPAEPGRDHAPKAGSEERQYDHEEMQGIPELIAAHQLPLQAAAFADRFR